MESTLESLYGANIYYGHKQVLKLKLERLSLPAKFTPQVQPAVLPNGCAPAGTICKTTGWGNTMSSSADSIMFSKYFRAT